MSGGKLFWLAGSLTHVRFQSLRIEQSCPFGRPCALPLPLRHSDGCHSRLHRPLLTLLLLGLTFIAAAWAYCFVLNKPDDPVMVAGYEMRRREKVCVHAQLNIP